MPTNFELGGAQIKKIVKLKNKINLEQHPYKFDSIDIMILREVAADEYTASLDSGMKPSVVPERISKKLDEASKTIEQSKKGTLQPYYMGPQGEIVQAIELLKRKREQETQEADTRWWAFWATIGTGLMTFLGFVGCGLLGPLLNTLSRTVVRHAADIMDDRHFQDEATKENLNEKSRIILP